MRWNFGGNLQPVRMICEYDWKECPVAFVSYVWSEIVTDVIESVTGEAQLWRILAVVLLCSMLLHAIYYKMRWVNESEHDFARNHLIKVGFKMQDLELKINILTYKMQYGTWPLPHEIPTPSFNELRNVKLTLSNTNRQNMWTKHHLHGYISKCIQNSEDSKSMNKFLSTSEELDLAHKNFLSQFENGENDFQALKSKRNLKLPHRENNCKDYERLIETAEECKRYMDEINESNKSLGLFENSSDTSGRNSVKDISAGNESDENSCRFLIDPKKWHELYKYKNMETEEVSESNLTASSQIFSMSNLKRKDLTFPDDDEQYPLKNSNRSRLLPPGLSITFLSDKFKKFASSDRCVSADGARQSRNKASTNETLNKVKEKLESLHDINHAMKNSKSLSNVEERLENKKSREIALSIKTSSKINSNKYEEKQHSDMKKLDKSISGASLGQLSREVSAKKIPARRQIAMDSNSNAYPEISPNTNLNKVKTVVQNPWDVSNEMNKNSMAFLMKKSSTRFGVAKNLARVVQGGENLSPESDSSTSLGTNSTSMQKPFDWNENVVRSTGSAVNDKRNLENNINLNSSNKSTSKTSTSYVLSPQDKPVRQMPMETDEDATVISLTSSQTELSKDSDTDDKSTTTLLREALDFKKALLIQIHKENEMGEEKIGINESSECDSDDTSRSKTDNHFRSKLLDIISEEQSAGSSTEKTSRTYILSRAINETNLCEDPDGYFIRNKEEEDVKCKESILEGECCGDSKSVVTASSSEYFSTNNVTDSEHTSTQRVNQCVADGDGVKELQKSCIRKMQEGEPALDVANNHENNNIAYDFAEELKRYDAREENDLIEVKSSDVPSKKSQVIMKKQTTNLGENYTQSQQESVETCLENSTTLNKLERFVRDEGDIHKIEASVENGCENQLDKTVEKVDSVAEKITEKSDSKIKLFRSLSSMDSERGISWNSISESSSNESMAKFVNTLETVASKNINTIAEQKLMMMSSTDYEGRNFATAGEDLRYSFNSHNRKQPGLVSLSEIKTSKQSHAVVEEILEKIEDCEIFKLDKPEPKEQNMSTANAFAGDHSEGSNLFNSHGVLKLDQEKLQRKQDIFSKLKSLDAFTKPLDITECNSEKNENEEDASPLRGRTVVCICNSNMTNIAESCSKTESDVLNVKSRNSILLNNYQCTKDFQFNSAKVTSENFVVDNCEIVESDRILNVSTNENKLSEVKSQHLVLESKLKESGEIKNNANTIDASQSSSTVTRISSTHYLRPVNTEKKENEVDAQNNWESSAYQSSDNSKCDTKLESKKMIQNSKWNQLSKSSITNFSTDTSESYFDLSNHDFAVSSVILTSQNSNFASNRREDSARSNTSSSYVDASDRCSKISSNLSSTEEEATSNLSAKKNDFSELQIANGNTEETEEIKTPDTGIPMKDITAENILDTKHEFLTKIQLIPKCTISLPSSDKKSQLNAQGHVRMKDEVCIQSSSSLNEDARKYWSSLNLEKSYTKGRAISRSCIPILKSRIETPRREKSMEAKARSRSPVRRSNTRTIRDAESNCQIGRASSTNESEKRIRQSSHGSGKSLRKKESYALPSENSDTRQECLNAKSDSLETKECKIVRSVSSDLAATPEKSNLLGTAGQSAKECTVIYINIISDSDRNDSQVVDTNELLKCVNEKDLISCDKRTDPECLSLRNIKSDRSDDRKYEMNVASPTSDNELCKNLSDGLKNGNEQASTVPKACLEAEGKDSTDVNDFQRISPPFGSRTTTANKLLSTSTLQLSNSSQVEKREMEILVKPSVKNTSTSVSNFSNASPEEKRSFYNIKNEVFDVSNDSLQKDQIVLSEMLTTDPNFFECKKTHRLYNKLGLGFQEQTEEL